MNDLEKFKRLLDEIGIKYKEEECKYTDCHYMTLEVDQQHIGSYGICYINFDFDTKKFDCIYAE